MTARLWRRADVEGHEAVWLRDRTFSGTAVFQHDGAPHALHYEIECTEDWKTQRATIWRAGGPPAVPPAAWPADITIEVDAGRWTLNGDEVPDVANCIDIDLNFSPSTNSLPLRRAPLAVGEEMRVRAAWLRFPSFALVPLDQLYRRVSESVVHYESATGYATDIEIDWEMFVVNYAGVWILAG